MKQLILFAALAAVTILSSCKKDDNGGATTYTITVTDDGHGTATAVVGGIVVSQAKAGDQVTLEATPNAKYEFKKWTTGGFVLAPSNTTATPATFTMPSAHISIKAEFAHVDGVMINGILWAKYNVDAFGTFAATPESFGMLYQWNRKKAWPATDTPATGWDSSTPSGESWEEANDPCPAGWRVPTESELSTLCETGKVTHLEAPLNGVNGATFTDKTTNASIFIPYAGYRYDGSGNFGSVASNDYVWSATAFSSYVGYGLSVYGGAMGNGNRSDGFSVRCVAE